MKLLREFFFGFLIFCKKTFCLVTCCILITFAISLWSRGAAAELSAVSEEIAVEQKSATTAEEVVSFSAEILPVMAEDVRSEYATLDTIFERVIGLGHWCLTKGQINAYFSPEMPWMKTKQGHADLFDWLFIYDYEDFAAALNNNLEDFFERKDFHIIAGSPNKAIENSKYNMRWNHLFDRYSQTYTDVESREDGFLTEEKLDFCFSAIKNKINYLKEKFISAKQYKTLYVISYPQNGPNLETLLPVNFETLVHVRDALITVRQGDKQFCLLFIPSTKTYEGTENIFVKEAKNLGNSWDEADPIRWKQIFDEFKFAPDIWA